MLSKPTKADAELFLQVLAMMRSDDEFKKAWWWLNEELAVKRYSYDEFKSKYPVGSEGYRNFLTYASYMETLGVLVNFDLLGEDLIFGKFGDLTWELVEPIAQGLRKDWEFPRLFEYYEVLAKKYPKWEEKNPIKI